MSEKIKFESGDAEWAFVFEEALEKLTEKLSRAVLLDRGNFSLLPPKIARYG